MVTYYVVQSFQRGRRGALVPDMPVQATDEGHARRMADRLSREKVGVVAFSRAGDLDAGEYEDAVILAVFGEIPPVDGEAVETHEFDEPIEEERISA